MARGSDMQEVELLDGDSDVAERPEPPARSRRGLWWGVAGAALVAASLLGTQLVLDAREDAAVARLAAVPGVFPPLEGELVALRVLSQVDAASFWSGVEIDDARTAGVVVAPDGAQSVTAVDHRTGETLWSTPLVGPSAQRAAAAGNSYGGWCQGDSTWGRPATLAVCVATDGFVSYGDDGTQEEVPATSTRIVVLDVQDGRVVAEWAAEEGTQVALLDDLVVVGVRDEERVVVVAHDERTGEERWRYEELVEDGAATSPQRYWGLFAAGSTVAMYDGSRLVALSSTGSLVRDDRRTASGDASFGSDPVTGTFSITTFAGTGARTTTLLADDADPAGDVVLRGDPLQVTVDDGSLPGMVLTNLSHAYAWDRRTGDELWEADVQPGYNALVIRGHVYLTTSTEVVSLDGRSGAVVWRTQLPDTGQGRLATDGRDLLLLSAAYDGSEKGRITVYDLATGEETRQVRYPEGVSEVELLHGMLVGWSYETDGMALLEVTGG